jgi:hypothetical protein
MSRQDKVPCGTCGAATWNTGTRRCDRCWEFERRIDDYLRAGGERARRVVEESLAKAAARAAGGKG